MNRLYNVTIEYLGAKKKHRFENATICLGKQGDLLVMNSDGTNPLFMAESCRVEQIAAQVIIISGFTTGSKPKHITAYCVYGGQPGVQIS